MTIPLVDPEPAMRYRRTPAQRADMRLSWERPDRAFFAAGACHILAFAFVHRWPDAGFEVVYLRPVPESSSGHHVYATDGGTAFDFNGFSRADALLAVNVEASRAENPDWEYERLVYPPHLDWYCASAPVHAPDAFPGDVIARADCYLQQLVAELPTS